PELLAKQWGRHVAGVGEIRGEVENRPDGDHRLSDEILRLCLRQRAVAVQTPGDAVEVQVQRGGGQRACLGVGGVWGGGVWAGGVWGVWGVWVFGGVRACTRERRASTVPGSASMPSATERRTDLGRSSP